MGPHVTAIPDGVRRAVAVLAGELKDAGLAPAAAIVLECGVIIMERPVAVWTQEKERRLTHKGWLAIEEIIVDGNGFRIAAWKA